MRLTSTLAIKQATVLPARDLGLNSTGLRLRTKKSTLDLSVMFLLLYTNIFFYNCSVWFRVFFSYDGNFHSVRKSKKVKEGDLCLSDRLEYFSSKGPYKEWTVREAQEQPQHTVRMIDMSHLVRY
jgi:hypothetical protein